MRPGHLLRLKLSLVVALLSAAWLFGKGSSGSPQEQIRALRTQAELFEKQGDWEKACRAYEELIKLDRNLPNVKQKYRYCVRRLLQVYRHRDETYRKDVLSLKYAHALRLYEIVSFYLLETSLDKRKLDAGLLFRKGLDEFKSALADPLFCKVHLNGLRPEQTREFRAYLEKTFGPITILTRDQALEAVREVAMKSLTTFKLNATTTVMEFVCGACHAVDEYSFYLTPNQLKDLYETWTGEYVGVGIRLTMQDGRLVIYDVLQDSPAAEKGLLPGDQVLKINRKATATLAPELAMQLLEGAAGTSVELVVSSAGMERVVSLQRRTLIIPSISSSLAAPGIGYVQISCFQPTTLQELDAALAELRKQDVKALILDLRGNSGGLVDVAIEVARRFLTHGVIVSTEHQDPSESTIYQARNPHALTLPLVVLIDGETASSAEILAGALKENRRATLVGQTTYGKGCSQGLRYLPMGLLKVPPEEGGVSLGGLRITMTRYFSPTGQPYSERGVAPHLFVERPLMPSMEPLDPQFEAARQEAQRLVEMAR